MLENLAEATPVADAHELIPCAGAAKRMLAQQRRHLAERVVDGAGNVEGDAGQTGGQPLAADRRQDRIHQPIQPGDLADRLTAPLLDDLWIGARPAAGGGDVGERAIVVLAGLIVLILLTHFVLEVPLLIGWLAIPLAAMAASNLLAQRCARRFDDR